MLDDAEFFTQRTYLKNKILVGNHLRAIDAKPLNNRGQGNIPVFMTTKTKNWQKKTIAACELVIWARLTELDLIDYNLFPPLHRPLVEHWEPRFVQAVGFGNTYAIVLYYRVFEKNCTPFVTL